MNSLEIGRNKIAKSDIEKCLDIQLAKIKQDLLDREMTISSVSACNPKDGNQTVIGYNPNGIIYFVSYPYQIINLYGSEFGKGGMYSIGDIYSTKAAEIYNANEEAKKKQKESEIKKREEEKQKAKENSKWRYLLSFKWIYDWMYNTICCVYGMSQKKGVVHMTEQNNTGSRK